MSDPWAGPRAAGRLSFAWSLFLMLTGVVLLVALPPLAQSAQDGYCGNGDHPGPCTNPAEWLTPGLVVLAIGAWCLVASRALLRHRRWGRWAVAATFSLWSVAAGPSVRCGALAEDEWSIPCDRSEAGL